MNQIKRELPGDIADPGIETVLRCRIETVSEYELGQPITIEGALDNSGSSDVWVLCRNTFLDPNWQDCVLLTHDGSPVPYVGIAVFHGAPNQDSYIRIPAGGSVSSQIDISEKYGITEPGNYEIAFYLPILGAADEGDSEPPGDEMALQLTHVESAKASFRIDGVASMPHGINASDFILSAPSPANSFPIDPQMPFFVNMDAQEEGKLRDAHLMAYKSIVVALHSVETTIDTEYYNTWFESEWPWGRKNGWENRRTQVIKKLSAMATFMSKARITYIKDDPDNKYCAGINGFLAWTVLSGKGPVHFCPRGLNDKYLYAIPFYAARTSLLWDYAFILTHEISHATAGTTDDWYSWYICGQLANFHPDLAVINAQNYALFVMMKQGSDLPMFRTYMIKCYNQKNGKFLGWLQSDGNWVTLNGDDPNSAPQNGCVSVSWYEYRGVKYLSRNGSSRYIGDNGNGGKGNTRAAWNLWARASDVSWSEPAGEVFITSNPKQRLGLDGDLSKQVMWVSSDAPPPYLHLRCEFQEV